MRGACPNLSGSHVALSIVFPGPPRSFHANHGPGTAKPEARTHNQLEIKEKESTFHVEQEDGQGL